MLEAFSYSIVHDMRAPLRSMQGFTRILMADHLDELKPEARQYLGRIETSAARMDQLIQDVLSFSRAAREEIALHPVDTDALLRDVVETYPDLHARKESIHIDGKLPVVMGNEAALTQCFANLLGNALKFGYPGRAPSIRVWAEDAGHHDPHPFRRQWHRDSRAPARPDFRAVPTRDRFARRNRHRSAHREEIGRAHGRQGRT